MIPAINDFTEGQIIKINLDYNKYVGLATLDMSLRELKRKSINSLHKKLRESRGSSYNEYEAQNIVLQKLNQSFFRNRDFLRDFLFNKIKTSKEDYINFSIYNKDFNFNYPQPLSDLVDNCSNNLNYKESPSIYNKRMFVKINDYLFYKLVDKMDSFILLGIFQLDKEKIIENNNIDIENDRKVIPTIYNQANPSCFIPTKEFFNKKDHNFKNLKSKLKLYNVKVVKDTLIDYEVLTPKIDKIRSLSDKINMLKLVQERASRDTFSTNRKLVLC